MSIECYKNLQGFFQSLKYIEMRFRQATYHFPVYNFPTQLLWLFQQPPRSMQYLDRPNFIYTLVT